jgi:putative ABC transport system ATP-binding protein
MDLLKDAARDDTRAVLVVTHDNRIFRYADRIVSMEDGRIVGDENRTLEMESAHAH